MLWHARNDLEKPLSPDKLVIGRMSRLSLHAQGVILVSLGTILVLIYGLFLFEQKDALYGAFTTLSSKQQLEGRLYRFSSELGRLDRELDESAMLQNPATRTSLLESHLSAIRNEVRDLLPSYPDLESRIDTLSESLHGLRRGSLEEELQLAVQSHRAAEELDRVIQGISGDREKLASGWFLANLAVAETSALASLLALAGFGGFSIFFFRRLTSDIRRLSTSAREIAAGNEFNPLEITRGDEVGELMEAMNWMADQLVEREKQLVIARQQYFHAEKMIAVSSLAASIAHEIGNPLESISSVAQVILDAKKNGCKSLGQNCYPQMILEHIQRVSSISRDLSSISGPSQPELRLQGLNELIRNTCRFMRYDRRYRNVELSMTLDPNIPAVRIVGDQFVQIIMNVLINAADAFDGSQPPPNKVSIATVLGESSIVVQVSDNGIGMDENTLRQAASPFFTTKAFGHGSGLGLPVCKSIIEAYGGTLALESQVRVGTLVTICWPIGRSTISPAQGKSSDGASNLSQRPNLVVTDELS